MPDNYLRYWRDHAGLTQKQLAKAVGKDWRTISRWENGGDIKISEQDKLAGLFGIARRELLFGPEQARQRLIEPPGAFEEDAVPYDPGGVPGLSLRLGTAEFLCKIKTDAVTASREGLRPGDLAIFDIGADALAALQDGRTGDGAVVMAQSYDDETGQAETIVRQWLGPWPGLLSTNRAGANTVLTLSLRDDIRIKGVLKRSLRSHAGGRMALPAPD